MNTQTTTTATRNSNAAKSRKVSNSSRTRKATTRTNNSEPKHVSEVIPEAVQEIKDARTARQEAARQRREELKATSNLLKKAVRSGMIPPSDDGTINGLLRDMYAQQGHTELKTFDEWKAAGYIVRKGQKAFLLWGKPRKHDQRADEKGAPQAATSEDGQNAQQEQQQDDFFPVCYVFSQLQVHPLNDKAEAVAEA